MNEIQVLSSARGWIAHRLKFIQDISPGVKRYRTSCGLNYYTNDVRFTTETRHRCRRCFPRKRGRR